MSNLVPYSLLLLEFMVDSKFYRLTGFIKGLKPQGHVYDYP